jgi:Cu(I)-responsive transcriptional regulator
MRIGEAARATGTKAETVRYYEREGLLPAPARTEGNYRDYGPDLLARLGFVRRARGLGFSMVEIRQLLALSDDPDRPCAAIDAVASAHLTEIDRKLADLAALRAEMARLLDSCRRGTVDDCRIVEALSTSHP